MNHILKTKREYQNLSDPLCIVNILLGPRTVHSREVLLYTNSTEIGETGHSIGAMNTHFILGHRANTKQNSKKNIASTQLKHVNYTDIFKPVKNVGFKVSL